jgi:5-methyltetrahydrofolate--homocysteine methyltransferase
MARVTSPSVSTPTLLELLGRRVLVADGAMGTMIQAASPSLDDFEGHEGCNEILNVTRPDIIASIHDAYLSVGCDIVETNTFGANLANLAEYGIESRIEELAEAGARIAREVADGHSSGADRRWVLGSVGPGTRLPTFGHARYADLRDAYEAQVRGMVLGGVDGVLVETVQDLLQAKAAINGARRAMKAMDRRVALMVQVTIETTGTMLVGSEIGAALTALEPLGIDAIGLNCATGPGEMSEHLRHLSRNSRLPISVMPNAGLPILGANGAHYPLTEGELSDALDRFVNDYGLSIVGGCCGTTPAHIADVVSRIGGAEVRERPTEFEPSVSSLYQSVPLRQDKAYLAIGERANANGSRAFKEAMLSGNWEECLAIAKDQVRDGAHVLDVCVDHVGRDGARDMETFLAGLSTASTLPLMLDSTEPEVVSAGAEMLGGRVIVNSVNFEDGDGPESRFRRMMEVVTEHGAAVVALTIDEQGQARTREWKVAVAERLISVLTGEYGMRESDILVDTLTFPIATGQEETRRDGVETIEAIRELKRRHPDVQTVLGLSNVSFGLSPAARVVLNSVFLSECRQAGLDAAIVHPSRIEPLSRIPAEELAAALDLIHDRREYDVEGNLVKDPLNRFLEVFQDVESRLASSTRGETLRALPLWDRLKQRIIDGETEGLAGDLDEALGQRPALEIINDVLLEGMRTVGELFGSGEMQLPFVLQSAETMKRAVAHLTPHLESTGDSGKGRIVLATVKGDVHDIGKNLVDIILTNNGYDVVNIGIKMPITSILEAAVEHDADVIGMSGLLVKSTVVMRENLEHMNTVGVATRFPVLLGGAALTRAYVEETLAEAFDGEVRYARDAFEGLRLMDAMMAVKRGVEGASLPALRGRRVSTRGQAQEPESSERSDVSLEVPVPMAPFFGTRVSKGLALADYASWIDERALFMGQWGLRGSRAGGASYEELVETEGRPRLRMWLDRLATEGLLEAAVIHGYFPCHSEGNDIVILDPQTLEECSRFSFPRQRRDRRLCLADYVRPRGDTPDVVAFHIVTMGSRISQAAADLFERNEYREYVELHGLSVQLTEALAEMWHARVREELGIHGSDAVDLAQLLKQEYQGERFSFGYPACPDLENQEILCELLKPERIGVSLSEEFQLHPEQSTSAIIFHHPEAHYFNA